MHLQVQVDRVVTLMDTEAQTEKAAW